MRVYASLKKGLAGVVLLAVLVGLVGSPVLGALRVGQVKSKHLLDNDVQSIDIADGGVGSIDIADGTVGVDDLAIASVTTDEIADGTISFGDLGRSAIRTLNLANDSEAFLPSVDKTVVEASLQFVDARLTAVLLTSTVFVVNLSAAPKDMVCGYHRSGPGGPALTEQVGGNVVDTIAPNSARTVPLTTLVTHGSPSWNVGVRCRELGQFQGNGTIFTQRVTLSGLIVPAGDPV